MDSSTRVLPIVDQGYDWITCTAPNDDQGRALISRAEDAMADEVQGDDFEEPWHFQGYHGFKKGHIRWGWGKQGGCVVMSSWCANRYAPSLAQHAAHWSRVDYQVTVFDATGQRNLGNEAWEAWHWRDNPGKGPCMPTRIETLSGGTSFYTGQRSSAKYGRIYDKHAESPRAYARGCWRYEVELKREQSELARQSEAGYWHSDEEIGAMVHGYYRALRLEPHFIANSKALPSGRCCREYDADRVAEWLERQVAPSVHKLAEARGVPYVRSLLNL